MIEVLTRAPVTLRTHREQVSWHFSLLCASLRDDPNVPIPYFIYALVDPLTHHVRYIGRSGDVGKRLVAHRSSWHLPRAHWIEDLERVGLFPEVRLVDFATTRSDAAKRERMWIRLLRREGGCDLNDTDMLAFLRAREQKA